MKTTACSFRLTSITIPLFALSVLLLLPLHRLGAKEDASPAKEVEVTGVYNLVSVDGKAVPCDVAHDGTSIKIKSGVFTISADGTCRSLMNFSVPSKDDLSREVKATYTRTGAELTMKWENAGITKGKVDGKDFSMNNEGMVLLYRK
jgi:hypothetical protein